MGRAKGVDGALHSSRRAGRRVDGSAFRGNIDGRGLLYTDIWNMWGTKGNVKDCDVHW